MGKIKPILCSVKGCVNSSKLTMTYKLPDSEIIMHRFPSDPYRKLQWSNAIGRPEVFDKKHKYLCSLHFADSCVLKLGKTGVTRLSNDAVPTVFPDVDLNAEKTPKTSKRKRLRKKTNALNTGNSDGESDIRNSNYGTLSGVGENVDYESDGINIYYHNDNNRNSDYGSGSRIGEYISEPHVPMSYISTSGKRSNPLQPIVRHQSPHHSHDPWGSEYVAPQQSPKHYRPPKTIFTPPKGIVKKNRQKVSFEDPAQQALRELREQRENKQMQFSLMSFAPIEVDQSCSFATPAGNEIQEPQQEVITPTTPTKRTVDPTIAAEVYLKRIEALEKKLKIERDRFLLYKKKFIAVDTINKRNQGKMLKMSTTIKKMRKLVEAPVFNLKSKNIKLTFA